MVDTCTVSDDGLTYSFTLRDGLKFHDGAPVTGERRGRLDQALGRARRHGPCDGYVGGMHGGRRQDLRDQAEGALRPRVDSLGKPSSNVPFIMPKRLAETPSTEPIPEQIGSGPFKWVADEFQPGVIAVYAKNEDYVPRDEPASWASGGKVVNVDRVEWVVMPDDQTELNALMSGEIDYWESPPADLLPILEANPDITRPQPQQARLPDHRAAQRAAPAVRQPRGPARRVAAITRRTCWTRWSATPTFTRSAAPCSSAARRWRPMSAPAPGAGKRRHGGGEGDAEGGRL